jgi:hypothetical protein
MGAENNGMGVRRKRRKKKNWASKPNCKAQDLLGPFDIYTLAPRNSFDKFIEHFFPSNSF